VALEHGSIKSFLQVMDGYTCAGELRALGASGDRLLIIGATGNALDEDQRAFIAAGADTVVIKPISVAAVKVRN
jgi:CheY-like chemotaxis protein